MKCVSRKRFNKIIFSIFFSAFLLLSQRTIVSAQESWVVYSRNYHSAYLQEQLNNIAKHVPNEFLPLNFVASSDMEQGRAFAELLKGNIDIFIGAPTLQREAQATLIPIPIDRGLLGFRLCLVHKDNEIFNNINSVNDMVKQNITLGVGSHWPDKNVYQANGIKTVSSPVHNALFTMLHKRRFDCLSRSVNEIQADLNNHKQLNIAIEKRLVLVYPLADFIFVNKNNKLLYQSLQEGLHLAISNKVFFHTFDKYYANDLKSFGVFDRKLLYLNNDDISDTAAQALNHFGIASFLRQSINKTTTLQLE